MECTRGTATRSHVPLVVREPEAGWWAAQQAGTRQAGSSVTVAAVRERDAAWHPEMVMSRLAALAADRELLVVFGSNVRSVQHSMAAGLRARLPRQEVVAMRVRHRHGEMLRDAAIVERLLDAGSLPVVVTPVAALLDVTAEIASYLRADRVLRVLRTLEGADLCQVWQRRREPSLN
ncbi:hypothetical protein [Actinoplanes subtropicus]|uniref:hypothetical protein n=1 Tax=Actinoplanes subtropicus TaxID=543632 RepID=UPI0004C4046E|nr:hypothetical protein [Actinoplanes subtropicus]